MIDNYNDFKKFLNQIDQNNKPTLLLHTCCAPCSTHTIKVLLPYFKITVFYDEYNNKDYLDKIKGHEFDGEKSIRCYLCYQERLEKTAIKAKELNFNYFTTSLSISPYKVTRWINEIGYDLENKYNVKYLYSNFKKEEGYKDSIKLSEEYGMYRQDYCGCQFSMLERKERTGE